MRRAEGLLQTRVWRPLVRNQTAPSGKSSISTRQVRSPLLNGKHQTHPEKTRRATGRRLQTSPAGDVPACRVLSGERSQSKEYDSALSKLSKSSEADEMEGKQR